MAAAKTAGAPARSRASSAQAAAIAEANGKPREIEYKGAKFVLPAHMPAEVLFIYADEEPADERATTRESFALLRAMLGEKQMNHLRSVVRSDGWTTDDFTEFAALVNAQYATTEGESEASRSS